MKTPTVTTAEEVKVIASESTRLAQQYEAEDARLTKKIEEHHKALLEFTTKKA